MTNPATAARDNAISLECKKDGFSQRQDGSMILRLRIHPNDTPDAIMKAAMGQRYMAVLVAIGDDEEPINNPQQAPAALASANPGGSHGPDLNGLRADAAGQCGTPDRPHTPRKPVDPTKRLAKQAGICCADPRFWAFLRERHSNWFAHFCYEQDTIEQAAAAFVRHHCGVSSRSEIVPDSPTAEQWERLHSQFTAWLLVAA